MNIESIIGKVIILALVGIGLYTFFALVDLIKTKGSKQMNKSDCYTCGEEFEDNNCEFCSFAYPFCSLECYDKYMESL